MSYKLVTAAASEPLTLQEAKDHLLVTNTTQNTYIEDLIESARIIAEYHTRKPVISSTWDYFQDELTDVIRLIKTPVSSITGVYYQDSDDNEQTLTVNTDYRVDLNSEPARIEIINTPSVKSRISVIRVRFVAGYADAASVPKDLKQAMLNNIGDMYANRQNVAGVQLYNIPYGSMETYERYALREL